MCVLEMILKTDGEEHDKIPRLRKMIPAHYDNIMDRLGEKGTAQGLDCLLRHVGSNSYRISKHYLVFHYSVQYNLNGSNPDGSFTVDDSNSFFSPYKILTIAQEYKYLGIFCLFYHCVENRKDFPKLSLFASLTGAIINPQWFELPMSRTNFHGPKDIRAIEVRLYFVQSNRVLPTLDITIKFVITII